MNERPLNYYKLKFRNNWCLLSFRCDPRVADCFISMFVRCNVDYVRLSPERALEHKVTKFWSYRIGAVRFFVATNSFFPQKLFFYKRFLSGYESFESVSTYNDLLTSSI